MRKTLWIIGLALAVPAVASAQAVPRVEVFGGYSYGVIRGYVDDQLDPGSGTASFPSFGSNGWTGSVAVRATRWLGAVADASGLYTDSTRKIGGTPITLSMREHSYLLGPQFSYRSERWEVFAHALFGEALASVTVSAPEVLTPLSMVGTKFAICAGGGVEYTVYSRRPHLTGAGQQFAIRPMQIDWLRTNFADSHQGNIRLSTGLVFRF